MEDICAKIEFLQCELGKRKNHSKAKQRPLMKQLKVAKQRKLDYIKQQLEEFEKMNQNLQKTLKMAKN
jgi:hypothetical protein